MLAAALRILNELGGGRTPDVADVDVVRANAIHTERDLELPELALSVAERCAKFQ